MKITGITFDIRLIDKVSIVDLHQEARIPSLEQRRQKQLLNVMYSFYSKRQDRVVTDVVTETLVVSKSCRTM